MDTTQTVNHLSLCTGYGGIDLGLRRAIPNLRTVAYSEIEAFACANLVSKMEAGCLDAAPIWTDLKTFPWSDFRGKVDILSGGYPCQPFSQIGNRLGAEDPRHLWPYISRGIEQIRPALCFFENVEGHLSLGLPTVISDLEELGYSSSWGLFTAAETGSPHRRKRVFVLAHALGEGLEGFVRSITDWSQPRWHSSEEAGPVAQSSVWKRVVFSAECDYDGECPVCGGWYGDCPCPGPTQDGIEHATFGDTLYGRPASVWPSGPNELQQSWEPKRISQPSMGGNTNGTANWMDVAELYSACSNRRDELSLLGNGVVPHTAEKAFLTLVSVLINKGQ